MLMKSGWPARLESAGGSSTDETPTSFRIAGGVVVLIGASLVAGLLPAHWAGSKFPILAATVAGFGAVTLDQGALAAITAVAFLINDGFFENRFGTLSWHGSVDLWRLGVLVVIGALGLAAGEAYRQLRALRHRFHTRSVLVAAQRIRANIRTGAAGREQFEAGQPGADGAAKAATRQACDQARLSG